MNSAKDQGVSVKYWMDDRLRLALLKESSLYRKFWNECGGEKVLAADHEKQEYYLKNPVPKGELRCFVGAPDPACPAGKVGFDFFHGLNSFDIAFNGPIPKGADLKTVLDALNPYSEELPDNLPFYFHEYPPVAQLVSSPFGQQSTPKSLMIHEHDYCVPPEFAINQLKPWERLLRIDLRRSKKDIKNEVGRYLDRVAKRRKNLEACNCIYTSNDGRSEKIDWSDNYAHWQTDVSRAREEAWRDLEIWRMRRGVNKRTFPRISKDLKIKVDAAKKAFAHAYFLIEGRQYTPTKFKDIYKEITLQELSRTCATCPEKPEHGGACKELCPEMLAVIDQYSGSGTELLTSTGVADGAVDFRFPEC